MLSGASPVFSWKLHNFNAMELTLKCVRMSSWHAEASSWSLRFRNCHKPSQILVLILIVHGICWIYSYTSTKSFALSASEISISLGKRFFFWFLLGQTINVGFNNLFAWSYSQCDLFRRRYSETKTLPPAVECSTFYKKANCALSSIAIIEFLSPSLFVHRIASFHSLWWSLKMRLIVCAQQLQLKFQQPPSAFDSTS